jgi:ankyrin repeat protein
VDDSIVRGFFLAIERGDRDDVLRAIAAEPVLLDMAGPHPYWGGRPCALTIAVEAGHLDIMRDILDAGAHPDAPSATYDGWSPLFCAVHAQRADMIELLLAREATVDAWIAAAMGDVAMIEHLLEADPDLVNRRGPNDATPIHFAATVAMADVLVNAGADLELLDKYGSTPLRGAAYAGRKRRDVARHLATLVGKTDIFIDVGLSDADAVRSHLEAQPDLVAALDERLGAASATGGTPLHLAATLGDADMIALLVNRGADVNALSRGGHTPLHYAAQGGHLDAARALLDRGALPQMRDAEHHGTPADWARFFDRHAMLELLDSVS